MEPSTLEKQVAARENTLLPQVYKCSKFGTIMNNPVIALETGKLYDESSIQWLSQDQLKNITLIDVPDLKQVIHVFLSSATVKPCSSSNVIQQPNPSLNTEECDNNSNNNNNNNNNVQLDGSNLVQMQYQQNLKQVKNQNVFVRNAQEDILDMKKIIQTSATTFQNSIKKVLNASTQFEKIDVGSTSEQIGSFLKDFFQEGHVFFKIYNGCLQVLDQLKQRRGFFEKKYNQLVLKEKKLIQQREEALKKLDNAPSFTNEFDNVSSSYFLSPSRLQEESRQKIQQQMQQELFQKQQQEQEIKLSNEQQENLNISIQQQQQPEQQQEEQLQQQVQLSERQLFPQSSNSEQMDDTVPFQVQSQQQINQNINQIQFVEEIQLNLLFQTGNVQNYMVGLTGSASNQVCKSIEINEDLLVRNFTVTNQMFQYLQLKLTGQHQTVQFIDCFFDGIGLKICDMDKKNNIQIINSVIRNAPNHGLFVLSFNNCLVQDSDVKNSGQHGINISCGNTIGFDKVCVEDSGKCALYLNQTNAYVINSSLKNSQEYGIQKVGAKVGKVACRNNNIVGNFLGDVLGHFVEYQRYF